MGKRSKSASPLIYKDTGDLRAQDEVDVDAYVSLRDRAKSSGNVGCPFFSGREPELRVFLSMLNDVGLGVLADSTYVVEGPPGAGKTALMAQCVSEVAVRPATSEGRIWLPVIVHSTSRTPRKRWAETSTAPSQAVSHLLSANPNGTGCSPKSAR